MSIDRSRRITFEEVAELYDEVRPSYPEELVGDVLALSGIPKNGRILEIGCGPGNATLLFARRGYQILAVELGEKLATIAAKHCQDYDVEIVNSAFEEWPLEEKVFDLAISADAFHWIPPEIGYSKVGAALKDSGSAAFFWNIPVDPGTVWSRAIDAVYERIDPELDNPDKAFTLDWVIEIIKENFESSGCFGEVTVKSYSWNETFTAEQYLKLLRTYSSHRGLEEGTRERLFSAVFDVIEQFGGKVEKPQMVALFHARVKR